MAPKPVIRDWTPHPACPGVYLTLDDNDELGSVWVGYGKDEELVVWYPGNEQVERLAEVRFIKAWALVVLGSE